MVGVWRNSEIFSTFFYSCSGNSIQENIMWHQFHHMPPIAVPETGQSLPSKTNSLVVSIVGSHFHQRTFCTAVFPQFPGNPVMHSRLFSGTADFINKIWWWTGDSDASHQPFGLLLLFVGLHTRVLARLCDGGWQSIVQTAPYAFVRRRSHFGYQFPTFVPSPVRIEDLKLTDPVVVTHWG